MIKKRTCWVYAAAVSISLLPLASGQPASRSSVPAPTALTPAGMLPATGQQTVAAASKTSVPLTGSEYPMPALTGSESPDSSPWPGTADSGVQGRKTRLSFTQIAPPPGSIILTGSQPSAGVEFGMRRDEIASSAVLNLEFTPSPSLIPLQSQFKVYLNDELMSAVAFDKAQLGKKNEIHIPLDPRYITDFNRVRIDFIGQYREICQYPGNSTLWMDIGRNSYLDVNFEPLPLRNDLSFFPMPFYDQRDNQPLNLPMVFAGAPNQDVQRAAAVLASWFGAQSAWRSQQFSALYNQIPQSNAIVFATNDNRPDFLRARPAVDAPVIEMIDSPANPGKKLLVIEGRNERDLVQAVEGIVQGNLLFRGDRVVINAVKPLANRRPYDAPNWVHTDRPVTLGELKTYPEQLQSIGMEPSPISVMLNLPPDLYLLRTHSIDMNLNYRYTSPPTKDSSRMDVSLNNQYLHSFPLEPKDRINRLLLRLPVVQVLLDGKNDLSIPALRLGAQNTLRFDFQFMNQVSTGSPENCVSWQPVKNQVLIDDDSTLDFSKYYHFITMPDLRAYASAGFPFSRMADLSDTLVVMPPRPTVGQMTTLLNAFGALGAQTGLAASKVTVTDDSSQIKNHDADLLLIGVIPPALKDDTHISLLVNTTQSWVQNPDRVNPQSTIMPGPSDREPVAETHVSANGPMGAIVSFQSPYNDQRSVVALMGDSPRGYSLLSDAINDSGKRAAMSGSVVIIRDSGVNSLRVGDIYYVGHLPWFERLWYALSNHPILLAVFAAISVVLLAWVLWRLLRIISRRRLGDE